MSLRILIEFVRKDEPPRTWITCPACERTDWYYTLCIEKCDLCGAPMASINNMDKSLAKRLKFHKEGFKL